MTTIFFYRKSERWLRGGVDYYILPYPSTDCDTFLLGVPIIICARNRMSSWKEWLVSWLPPYWKGPQLDPLPAYEEALSGESLTRPNPKHTGRYTLKPDRILSWYYGERVKAGLPKFPEGSPDA